MILDKIEIGEFLVQSGALKISDPCYDPGTWCAGDVQDVVNGTWEAFVLKGKTEWGYRVWEVFAVAKDCTFDFEAPWMREPIDVGVDSGQAGIYDLGQYFKGGRGEFDEPGTWYEQACYCTSNKTGAGILKDVIGDPTPCGVVARSGFGDGSYECLTQRDYDGKAYAVRIVFISDQDVEDYGEEE